MHIEPLDDVLRREIDENDAKVLNFCAEAIEEAVNIGTYFLHWESERNIPCIEGTPIVMLFRHILDTADAISVLVKNSSVDPCKALMRVIVETSLQLEYMLEKNTEQRAYSYMTCFYKTRLKNMKPFVANSKDQKEFLNQLKGKTLSNIDEQGMSVKGMDSEIIKIENLLKGPFYRKYSAEYDMLKRKSNRSFQWYHMFKGPENFLKLAERLNKKDFYVFLYRQYSESIHASDVFTKNLQISPTGVAHALNIRSSSGVMSNTHIVIQLLTSIQITLMSIRYPAKGNEYANWYGEYRKNYIEIFKSHTDKIDFPNE